MLARPRVFCVSLVLSALSFDRDNFHAYAAVHLAAAFVVIAGNGLAFAHADGLKTGRIDIAL